MLRVQLQLLFIGMCAAEQHSYFSLEVELSSTSASTSMFYLVDYRNPSHCLGLSVARSLCKKLELRAAQREHAKSHPRSVAHATLERSQWHLLQLIRSPNS